MFTKVLLAVIIGCLAVAVRSSIVGCDPFAVNLDNFGETVKLFVRDFHSTCPDSIISWTTGEEALEISAAMDRCDSALPAESISTASVYFSTDYRNIARQYALNISTSQQYSFSYSIKWNEPNTFCVVDLTGSAVGASEIVSINMADQNGLSNKPDEDLSAFATGQWYTRSFTINGSAFNGSTSLRFGFSCIANTSDPASQVQKAYVDNIIFQPVGDDFARTLYSHGQNCTRCHETAPAVREAYCNETTLEWNIGGPANITRVNFAQLVTVNGDLFTDEIALNYFSFRVTGCIYPLTPGGVVNIAKRDDQYYDYNSYWIYMGSECNIDSWNIPFNYRFLNGAVYIEIGTRTPFYHDEYSPGDYSAGAVTLTLWIVIPVACAVGIIIGLVLGIKKYRAKKLAKKLDEEMAQTKEVETAEH
jgi:hypothetical protein